MILRSSMAALALAAALAWPAERTFAQTGPDASSAPFSTATETCSSPSAAPAPCTSGTGGYAFSVETCVHASAAIDTCGFEYARSWDPVAWGRPSVGYFGCYTLNRQGGPEPTSIVSFGADGGFTGTVSGAAGLTAYSPSSVTVGSSLSGWADVQPFFSRTAGVTMGFAGGSVQIDETTHRVVGGNITILIQGTIYDQRNGSARPGLLSCRITPNTGTAYNHGHGVPAASGGMF